MTKRLAGDTLIMLHNKLSSLAIRDPKRKLITKEAAELYGVSIATIYRALGRYNKLSMLTRADYNKPRLIACEKMHQYCKLIAALKLRTSNKRGRHLSNSACIKILEDYGIEMEGELVKVPKGLLKKSTVSFYVVKWDRVNTLAFRRTL